jgi:DNA polymerase-3 subunit delta'
MHIIGHDKIVKLLDKAITRNGVSHAYLFYGPENVGKFTVALEFSKKLTNNITGINPDLIIIRPEVEEKKGITKKRDIKIDQINDLNHQLSLSRQQGNYKVVIIDEAERLNKNAQNSLLKTLEEAGPGIVLILVAHDQRRLLPTILSRCQKMRFGTVPEGELVQELEKRGLRARRDIIFWSLGRPGLLIELVENQDALDFRNATLGELEKMFALTVVERFALAEELAKDTQSLMKKIDLWLIIFREMILGRTVLAGVEKRKALVLLDQAEKSQELIKGTNSNARLILENLVLNF